MAFDEIASKIIEWYTFHSGSKEGDREWQGHILDELMEREILLQKTLENTMCHMGSQCPGTLRAFLVSRLFKV